MSSKRMLVPVFVMVSLWVSGCTPGEKQINIVEGEASKDSSVTNSVSSDVLLNGEPRSEDEANEAESPSSTPISESEEMETANEEEMESNDDQSDDSKEKDRNESQSTQEEPATPQNQDGDDKEEKSSSELEEETTVYSVKEAQVAATSIGSSFAVEVKRANIDQATKESTVVLEYGERKAELTYDSERKSFNNYSIKGLTEQNFKEAKIKVSS
ncbi:hypothetical protein N781_01700 [Pontibacillus halophilus JSM 076056 = DSM 19796]|uniref:Uncharacterized protein n=1 Tax=Pontibacillus halophilus JSM 076056 = DSM 19796 TaxID=1385510 RepID=A0A0A5GS75_9BACI|nr:hypothetical protein [Pontibacillus halophilus]KGX94088.1 hypothetical protein N781_01700 [Pontibacillus halophilus JSM 076056 = DSM 19796]